MPVDTITMFVVVVIVNRHLMSQSGCLGRIYCLVVCYVNKGFRLKHT